VAKGDIVATGSVSADVAKYGTAQPVTYTVRHDTGTPQAQGTVDFYVSGGKIIGQSADYIIYGTTPTYLVAPGVAAANADLVAAGQVTAFSRATGAAVAKGDIVATGSVSADVSRYGTAQAVTFTVRHDAGTPQAQGTVDFYVNGGKIIGESADYVIYGTTPTYLVAPGVAAANADLVAAGQVTAFNRATGAKVAKGDIVAAGSVSADASLYGAAQPVTYTVRHDTSTPQAQGTVDFYVATGAIIGESADYIIYGVTPRYLDALGVPAANADLVAAGLVTAFNKATGASVPSTAIVATGTLSADATYFGASQPIRYTVSMDPSSPQASGTVDFRTSGGVIIAQNEGYVIYGLNPTYLAAVDVDTANADLVAAGQVIAFEKATGAPVPRSAIEAIGVVHSGLARYGTAQMISFRITTDPTAPQVQGSVDFYVAAPTYMLSYDGNGHDSGNAPAPSFHTAGDSATVAAPAFARRGYTFLGYNEDKAAGNAVYQPGDSITMTGDMLLYAVWQKDPEPVSPFIPLTGDALVWIEVAIFALAASLGLFLLLAALRRRGYNRSEP
jgi:hypothetical protein